MQIDTKKKEEAKHMKKTKIKMNRKANMKTSMREQSTNKKKQETEID